MTKKEIKYIELGFTGPDKDADKDVQEVVKALDDYLLENTELWLPYLYPDVLFDKVSRKFYFVELEPISGDAYLQELKAILERATGREISVSEVEESCLNLNNVVKIPLKHIDHGT